jgi:gamma-glutamylcyclotransferase (GGCT)/AIG2-like uncharacterized protein YtfP
MDGERQPSKENNITMMTTLFVYGTLKRGCWNHDRFCRGVLSVEEAVVRGRLYEMPSGIPVLQVPEEDILARGTADPLADVATQARFAGELASYLEPVPESATAGDCGPVYGELLTFDDPETRLPAIDRLEGFHPGGRSLYRRVLAPVCIDGRMVPSWLYAAEASQHSWRLLQNGVWSR